MNVLLVCVNYNSNNEMFLFLHSLEKALNYADNDELELTVCIADNSTDKCQIDLNKYSFNCYYYSFNNLGSFGGATAVFDKQSNLHKYEYIIISNVDLVVDRYFFNNLSDCSDCSIGWISPSILSSYENRDKGLGLVNRPSKFKLRLLAFMYKYPWLVYLVEKTIYKRKRLVKSKVYSEKTIYSGHGSFVILTKNFFKIYENFHYPMFLWGEELFLGELVRKCGQRVVYNPNLKVYDKEHASTALLPSAFRCKCQRDSLLYILDTFYSNC